MNCPRTGISLLLSGSVVETEIMRVVSFSTTEITEITRFKKPILVRRTLLAGKRGNNYDLKQFPNRYDDAWSENREVLKNSVHVSNEMKVD